MVLLSLVTSAASNGIALPCSQRELEQRFSPEVPGSLRALLERMGPVLEEGGATRFVAAQHGFWFNNKWKLAANDARALADRMSSAISNGARAIEQQTRACIRDAVRLSTTIWTPCGDIEIELPTPDFVLDAIFDGVGAAIQAFITPILAGIMELAPGTYGRCGGMAFAALDFFLAKWPVDDRFGTTPPESGKLRQYIWQRLLDSLDQNLGRFVDAMFEIHLLPAISVAATAALVGLASGTIAGPIVGLAIAALLAGEHVDFFHLGGASKLLGQCQDDWRRLAERLDGERAPVWPLGLVYGNELSPAKQHQVLATALADRGDGTGTLTVYDNAHPCEDLHWVVDLRGPELVVTGDRLADKDIKSILCEEYHPAVPYAELKLPPR